MYFSQKLLRFNDKQNMFLIGDIQSQNNLITALEYSNSSGYWFMVLNMENIDFCICFTVPSQQ